MGEYHMKIVISSPNYSDKKKLTSDAILLTPENRWSMIDENFVLLLIGCDQKALYEKL